MANFFFVVEIDFKQRKDLTFFKINLKFNKTVETCTRIKFKARKENKNYK